MERNRGTQVAVPQHRVRRTQTPEGLNTEHLTHRQILLGPERSSVVKSTVALAGGSSRVPSTTLGGSNCL